VGSSSFCHSGYFATKKSDPLSPLEIKTITNGKERVYLALRSGQKHMFDSAAFLDLTDDYVVLSDSLGIAIARPTEQEWTVGRITRGGSVSVLDIPYVAYAAEEFAKDWQVDSHETWRRSVSSEGKSSALVQTAHRNGPRN
jgi:hypothetical protein